MFYCPREVILDAPISWGIYQIFSSSCNPIVDGFVRDATRLHKRFSGRQERLVSYGIIDD